MNKLDPPTRLHLRKMYSVGSLLCRGWHHLKEVHAADLTCVEYAAFANCSQLAAFTEMSDSLQLIGGRAFAGCASLRTISSRSVRRIFGCAFDGCFNLEHVNMQNIQFIAPFAFSRSGLKHVDLTHAPADCVREHAFDACRNLESFRFPSKCAIVPRGVLYGCRSLKYAILPYHCVAIGENAFADCMNLQYLCVGPHLYVDQKCFDSKCIGMQSANGSVCINLKQFQTIAQTIMALFYTPAPIESKHRRSRAWLVRLQTAVAASLRQECTLPCELWLLIASFLDHERAMVPLPAI